MPAPRQAKETHMFKHILIPTDGSSLSRKGIKAGVKLAGSLGARVTGLYVMFPYVPPMYGEAALYYVPGLSPAESKKIFEKQAAKALAVLEAEAKTSRVRCDVRSVTAGQPWEAILRTARSRGCDAIVMASHGRSGLGGAILGSETTHVLAKSKIPVLVVR
jgi:nucleotide-binding universal stress UspA family protein